MSSLWTLLFRRWRSDVLQKYSSVIVFTRRYQNGFVRLQNDSNNGRHSFTRNINSSVFCVHNDGNRNFQYNLYDVMRRNDGQTTMLILYYSFVNHLDSSKTIRLPPPSMLFVKLIYSLFVFTFFIIILFNSYLIRCYDISISLP